MCRLHAWKIPLAKYHDLYVQSDTLLLADVFNNFWKMCLEIYVVDLPLFFSGIRISLTGSLKKDQSKVIFIN